MRLQLKDVIETGVSELDNGITDLQVALIDGQVHVYSTTGRNGGVAGYTVGANGNATLTTSVIFPPEITGAVNDRLVFSADGSGPMLYLGTDAQGLIGYSLTTGNLGADTRTDWDALQAMASGGGAATVEALMLLSEQGQDLFPFGFECTQIVDLVSVTVNGQDLMLTVCDQTNRVTAFRMDTNSGQLVEVGSLGALEGLGIDAPTAMEFAQINGQTYVLVAAAGTSSISVLKLASDGSLVPTDHLLDNGTTRFEGVQDLAVAQSGDHVFVVAGGADNGITLFLLMPDGTLVQLQTIADGDATSMFKVTALSVVIEGDLLHVFVGSQNDSGITQFTLDLTSLGGLEMGTAAAEVLVGSAGDDILFAVGSGDTLRGGAGEDVLVAGDDQTRMTGGAGEDIFVFRDGSGSSYVLDFERDMDRLDLTGLPMLRDLSQLSITTTPTGARIEFRGHSILVTAADGLPLTSEDLFPGGLVGGDHIPYIPPDDSEPGIELTGTIYRDNLVGTERNDLLRGIEGRDTISADAGDDYVDGGAGSDQLDGGVGNDTINGGLGPDTIRADAGDDWISGGAGNDQISANDGNDVVSAGDGRDTIYGGAGNDSIDGGAGADLIFGGVGNDTLRSVSGNDTVYGGPGEDLAILEVGGSSAYAGPGRDTVQGSEWNDTLAGGLGDDVISGGGGNDLIYAGRGDGSDVLNGGGGNDRIYSGAWDDLANGGAGNDSISGGLGRDTLNGDAGGDAIWGGPDDDLIDGGAGHDWLSGESGNDTIFGGAGNDTIRGGSGDDVYWGGGGADVFEFFGDHDTGWIMDFDPSEGDILRLEDSMWVWQGALTVVEVVSIFGSIDASGNVVLDFTDVGGAVIILDGFDDLNGLANAIELM